MSSEIPEHQLIKQISLLTNDAKTESKIILNPIRIRMELFKYYYT